MAVLKATPKAYLQGIQDLSRRAPAVAKEQIPQHLPHFFLLTERGPEEPQLAVGDAFNSLYGAKSMDFQRQYATHQTVLAQAVMAAGNAAMFQRVKPSGAKTAFLRVSLELIRTKLPKWVRNADGSLQIDSSGNYVQEVISGTPQFIEGFRGVFHTKRDMYPTSEIDTSVYGAGVIVSNYRSGGVLSSSNQPLSSYDVDAQSTVYPLFDTEISSFGGYGDNIGLRLWAPNSDSLQPSDNAFINREKAYLYRMALIERADANSTPVLLTTKNSDRTIEQCLVGGKTDAFGNLVSMQDAFIDAYQDLDSVGVTPLYGPFGKLHVYESNLATVLGLLTQGMAGAGALPTAPGEKDYDDEALAYGRSADIGFTATANENLFNLFTGIDQNGVPYWTYSVDDTVRFGGVAFGEGSNHYASGGDDGLQITNNTNNDRLVNMMTYDTLVAAEMDAWGVNSLAPMLDDAKYPVSAIWDSGFSLETKKKLLIPMSRRKDIITHLATQEVAGYDDPLTPTSETWKYRPQNDEATEQAIGQQLRLAAELYPESEVFGTPVCRAVIIGQSGYLLNSTWKLLTPLSVDMASKVASYMGAGDQAWINANAFDVSPANQITKFRPSSVNLTWKTDQNYHKSWDAGIIYVKNYDRSSLFVPAYQTVYPDDTSVLNNYFTVAASAYLEKVAQRTWRDLTGMSLQPEQFIERSNKLIEDQVAGKFDGRFVIVPNTYISGGDAQRGYSWSCDITIYAPNMRTVGTFTIVSRRIEDLQAAA